VPDKWEFPYYAAWDTAFQAVTFALIDLDFAKQQLLLLTEPRYMNFGQIPACEFNFDDVNPPLQAWAAWKVYETIERNYETNENDIKFLRDIASRLWQNLWWWLSLEKYKGQGERAGVFSAGFLGLDNISIIDRNQFQASHDVNILQVDATAWMAFFFVNMIKIASELDANEPDPNPMNQEMAKDFFEVFLDIAQELNRTERVQEAEHKRVHFWDVGDHFYYEILVIRLAEFALEMPLKYRSIIGLIPLFAAEIFKSKGGKKSEVLFALRNCFNDPGRRIHKSKGRGGERPFR